MLNRIRAQWQTAALVVLNTLLVFGVANLAAWLLLIMFPEARQPHLDMQALLEAHPTRTRAEILQIQDETWDREYVYEAFTQFKEGRVAGEFVRVDESGFRQSPGGAPWPPDPQAANIFVFGGSTTFGYGLADEEAIPAALQRHIHRAGCTDARVYNLARSNYFSTQERILFEQLLLEGHAPRAVIFIDGFNEFVASDGLPKYTERLAYRMTESRGQLLLRAVKQLPFARLAKRVRPPRKTSPDPIRAADIREVATSILDRWENNRALIRAVASSRGIATFFVLQPVPNSDRHSTNPFLGPEAPPLPSAELLKYGYEIQEGRPKEPDFWQLDDLPAKVKGPLFVDRVHYSATLSSAIAAALAQAVAQAVCPELQSTPLSADE